MKFREIEDYTTLQIPGKNAWASAKKTIWNMFYKSYAQEGKFVFDVSSTEYSPGFRSVAHSREDLQSRLDFVEKRHVQEGSLFNFHFYNLYFREAQENIFNRSAEKIEKKMYKGELALVA